MLAYLQQSPNAGALGFSAGGRSGRRDGGALESVVAATVTNL